MFSCISITIAPLAAHILYFLRSEVMAGAVFVVSEQTSAADADLDEVYSIFKYSIVNCL